eukprot:c16202_g1_i1.p1 GENE.c16202_g1_i1~~c16202_g1_i1.p1  ORF type:complete len:382 (+),score=179.00 c16202_g1_i1:51-1196(+)
MGIKQLAKLISDNCPQAIKEGELKNYFDRKIAIDASMTLYQFMIAIRTEGNLLTNEAGEVTSHLQGLFSRTIRLMESGVKPVYVFDGKPPTMKGGELMRRKHKSAEAKEDLSNAKEEGNADDAEKFSKRTVRVTKEQNEEAKKLLLLMGIPCVVAEGEAEATCAALCKSGKVFATGTEDMDALTFGSSILLRHLHTPEARRQPILEFDYKTVLEGLGLTSDQFIDLCILCGCDYCDSIRGIGPTRALQLIKKHGNIENIIANLDTTKYPLPESFEYNEVRRLFKTPDVTDPESVDFKWNAPDEEGLVEFLCKEKGFNEPRVRSSIEKLKKCRKGAGQQRLENFFGIQAKRKAPPAQNEQPSKKLKTSSSTPKGRPPKGRGK